MSRPTDSELSALLEQLAVVSESSADYAALDGFEEEAQEIYSLVRETRLVVSQLRGQDA